MPPPLGSLERVVDVAAAANAPPANAQARRPRQCGQTDPRQLAPSGKTRRHERPPSVVRSTMPLPATTAHPTRRLAKQSDETGVGVGRARQVAPPSVVMTAMPVLPGPP